MTIVSEFSDEGLSGKNIKGRPEFMRMMEKIESGEDNIDYVLVFKLFGFAETLRYCILWALSTKRLTWI